MRHLAAVLLVLVVAVVGADELQLTGRNAEPRHGIDFLGPLWLSRTFKITCCRRGEPVAENPQLISNWTQTASDYAIDENQHAADYPRDDYCRVFQGSFLLSATALYNSSFTGYGVLCKCPENSGPLDQHCRQLAPCQNGGYRSQSMGRRCSCPQPYFGDFCEKTCDQGQVLVGIDGHNYCSCLPFYQGEMCTDLVCLNGGFEIRGRCSCPHNFLGYHCEIDGNRTSRTNTRFQRYGESGELFSRDISGTVFSLVMIVVLVVSMYLLMKHRMQVQSQFAASRRDEMSRAAAVYGFGPQGNVREDLRIVPFVAAGINAPPPYAQLGSARDRNGRPEVLPPLPSYEDATKDSVIGASASEVPPAVPTVPPPPGTPPPPLEPQDSELESSTSSNSAESPLQPGPADPNPIVGRLGATRRSL